MLISLVAEMLSAFDESLSCRPFDLANSKEDAEAAETIISCDANLKSLN